MNFKNHTKMSKEGKSMSFARRLSEKLKRDFPTFQLSNFSALLAAALLALAMTARAAAPQDTEVGLGEVGLPVYGADD